MARLPKETSHAAISAGFSELKFGHEAWCKIEKAWNDIAWIEPFNSSYSKKIQQISNHYQNGVSFQNSARYRATLLPRRGKGGNRKEKGSNVSLFADGMQEAINGLRKAVSNYETAFGEEQDIIVKCARYTLNSNYYNGSPYDFIKKIFDYSRDLSASFGGCVKNFEDCLAPLATSTTPFLELLSDIEILVKEAGGNTGVRMDVGSPKYTTTGFIKFIIVFNDCLPSELKHNIGTDSNPDTAWGALVNSAREKLKKRKRKAGKSRHS